MGDHFEVVEALLRIPFLLYDGAVDSTDRMNFLATSVLLIGASLVVTLREYMMEPVTCYMATSPGGENLLRYMENFCWSEGTMSMTDPTHKLPQTLKEWNKFMESRTVYYQWVPFMFIIQCGMFYAPHIFWTMMCSNVSGFNVEKFITNIEHVIPTTKAQGNSSNKFSEQKAVADYITNMLVQNRRIRRQKSSQTQIPSLKPPMIRSKSTTSRKISTTEVKELACGKRQGIWLILFYFIMKSFYLINSLGQLFIMQHFLQFNTDNTEYNWWFGIQILWNIGIGRSWQVTGAFPRVVYCMAQLRHQANLNIHVSQCVLTANIFIEKIYIFFWFWMFILTVANIVSTAMWVKRVCTGKHQIKRYLNLHGFQVKRIEEKHRIKRFCNDFLRYDGLFLLEMLAINRGRVMIGPIVTKIYTDWLKSQGHSVNEPIMCQNHSYSQRYMSNGHTLNIQSTIQSPNNLDLNKSNDNDNFCEKTTLHEPFDDVHV